MRHQLIQYRLFGGFLLTSLGLGLASHSVFSGPPNKTQIADRNSVTSAVTDSVTENRPKYALRRGQEFAFDVQLGSKSAGDARWSGRPYVRVLYPHQNQMPALVMVIGKLECSEPTTSGWVRNSNGDIRFPDFLWVTQQGPLTTTLATPQSPHRLPRQMSAIFPYEELLFPRLPHNNELDHRSGSATCYLSTSGELTGATRTSIDLTRNAAGSRVVCSSGFYCVAKETGLKFEQSTNFDPKDTLPIDSTVNYTLRSKGDWTLTSTIRRLRGDEVAVARQVSSEAFPKKGLPKFLGRVPVELDQIPETFPQPGSALRMGERVLCADTFLVENHRIVYWFYGRLVRHLDERRALVRLDGSEEFLEANYSSIKRCP